MVTQVRMDLDHARVVTARELSRDTASVIESVVEGEVPAIITKHGRITAVMASVAHLKEAALLGSKAARPFLDTLETHDVEGVAQGLTARDALESVNAERSTQDARDTAIPDAPVATVRRLNQDTSAVLNEVRDSVRPVLVTRYGRALVVLIPVAPGLEEELLSKVAAQTFTATLNTGLHDGAARGLTAEQARAHVHLDSMPN